MWNQIQSSRMIDGSEKREIQKKMLKCKQEQQDLVKLFREHKAAVEV